MLSGFFCGIRLYAPQHRARSANSRNFGALYHWPLLDDIPAVGVPFLTFERKNPMSITAERKQALMTEFATAKGDTGSPEVQVAIFPSASRT